MLPEEGVNAVRVVVALLVRGDYEELETLTEGRRLSASDMAAALAGHDLLSPPEEAFGELEVTGAEQVSAGERAFHVAFPLWTARDGRSALTLRLTVTEIMAGVWAADLDGIGP
ncbi:DUF7668 domain-containing protein [Actinomadura madurae]|uniref:DUF7668 domain-containing protein n=1 Tax=Actinomadura madurae TaxID=1993 RepID=UPI0020266607|nr:hypothetical protein [Actinomadura madurae]MCP9985146.1 hypothetical protein [Actinomadura madurae]MCQ0012432.1 hypothetical protein [Actinomadura madurae]URN01926.1 hypothetical protein LUW76_47670 [Actinomadura madurae]URN03477.1 hypothetical protein LUW74_09080 [Actinomadura madurae]